MKTDNLLTSSKIYVRNRGLTGIAIFIFWLILFFLGMSVPSSQLHPIDQDGIIMWGNLWLYSLTFTPTNTAMLAALAGILGGIASNLSAHNKREHIDVSAINRNSFEYRSLMYMNEHPVVSMFRGFLAYLALVAVSYITSFSIPVDGASTIMGMSPSAYFKFSVTASLLSYLVGYDPTQIQRLISALSGVSRKTAEFEGYTRIIDNSTENDYNGKASLSEADVPNGTYKAELNGRIKDRRELV